MADEVRVRLQRIGDVQKDIILWLGEKQGVITRQQLKQRWPATKTVNIPSIGAIAELIQRDNLFASRTETKPTEYAPYLEESYFKESKEDAMAKDGWIAWNPESILGHRPSSTESTSLSKGIRGLEDRELLETAKVYGKKRRISHVKLTFFGEVASVLLRQNEN